MNLARVLVRKCIQLLRVLTWPIVFVVPVLVQVQVQVPIADRNELNTSILYITWYIISWFSTSVHVLPQKMEKLKTSFERNPCKILKFGARYLDIVFVPALNFVLIVLRRNIQGGIPYFV
jgi:hypothetical protein